MEEPQPSKWSVEYICSQQNSKLIGAIIVSILVTIFLTITIVAIVLISVSPSWTTGSENGLKEPGTTWPAPLRVSKAAVAADHPTCSTIGSQVMKEGGNAIDAMVATSICLGVVNPFASGIGGGAVILIRLANGTVDVIDGRETAPGSATQNMYKGRYNESLTGPRAVGIPGELRALEMAWNKYKSGNVTWRRLFEPSINLSQNGFPIGDLLARQIQNYLVNSNTNVATFFTRDGKLLQSGQTLTNPALAATLDAISKQGANAFYNSNITVQMVNDLNKAGGNFTVQDFANYRAMQRQALFGNFLGEQIITVPPPFSGGAALLLALNIIERFNLPEIYYKNEPAQAVHWMVEGIKYAFSDRMALGDPDFNNLTDILSAMLSKDHAATLRKRLSPDKTFPSEYYQDLIPLPQQVNNKGTSHFSIVDPQRNAVACTTTINDEFGSKFMSTSTGVIFNDELNDFSIPDAYAAGYQDLPPAPANFPAAGKRPLSSMTPMITLQDGDLHYVLGASGGKSIISGVLQVFMNMFGNNELVNQAVSTARFSHTLYPNVLKVENDFPPEWVTPLQQKGHVVEYKPLASTIAAVQAIAQENGTLLAASDWRKNGKPDGF